MALVTKKLNDSAKGKGVTAIVYGETGSGKSSLLTTLEGKTLILSSDNGLTALNKASGFNADNFDVFEVFTYDEFEGALHEIANNSALKGYDNLAIDDATEIFNLVLSNQEEKEEQRSAKEKSKIDNWNVYRETKRDSLSAFKLLRDTCKNSNVNLIVNCKIGKKTLKQENGEVVKDILAPLVPGQALITPMTGAVDLCGMMFRKNVDGTDKYGILFGANDEYVTKFRGNISKIEPPNLAKIFEKVRNS